MFFSTHFCAHYAFRKYLVPDSKCRRQIVFHINICHRKHGGELLSMQHVFYWTFLQMQNCVIVIEIYCFFFYIFNLQILVHNIIIRCAIFLTILLVITNIHVCNIIFIKYCIHMGKENLVE